MNIHLQLSLIVFGSMIISILICISYYLIFEIRRYGVIIANSQSPAPIVNATYGASVNISATANKHNTYHHHGNHHAIASTEIRPSIASNRHRL